MVYVIVDSEKPDKALLVKADNEQQLRERIRVLSTEVICGCITSIQAEALTDAHFCVVST